MRAPLVQVLERCWVVTFLLLCVLLQNGTNLLQQEVLSGRCGSCTVEKNTGNQLQDWSQSSALVVKYFIYYRLIICIWYILLWNIHCRKKLVSTWILTFTFFFFSWYCICLDLFIYEVYVLFFIVLELWDYTVLHPASFQRPLQSLKKQKGTFLHISIHTELQNWFVDADIYCCPELL